MRTFDSQVISITHFKNFPWGYNSSWSNFIRPTTVYVVSLERSTLRTAPIHPYMFYPFSAQFFVLPKLLFCGTPPGINPRSFFRHPCIIASECQTFHHFLPEDGLGVLFQFFHFLQDSILDLFITWGRPRPDFLAIDEQSI